MGFIGLQFIRLIVFWGLGFAAVMLVGFEVYTVLGLVVLGSGVRGGV